MTDGKDVKSLPNLIQGKWEIPPNYMNNAFDGKNTMIPIHDYMNGSVNSRNIILPARGYGETSYDSDRINEALITLGKSWPGKNRGDAFRKLYEASSSNKVFISVLVEEKLLTSIAALPQGDLVQLLQVVKSFSDNPREEHDMITILFSAVSHPNSVYQNMILSTAIIGTIGIDIGGLIEYEIQKVANQGALGLDDLREITATLDWISEYIRPQDLKVMRLILFTIEDLGIQLDAYDYLKKLKLPNSIISVIYPQNTLLEVPLEDILELAYQTGRDITLGNFDIKTGLGARTVAVNKDDFVKGVYRYQYHLEDFDIYIYGETYDKVEAAVRQLINNRVITLITSDAKIPEIDNLINQYNKIQGIKRIPPTGKADHGGSRSGDMERDAIPVVFPVPAIGALGALGF